MSEKRGFPIFLEGEGEGGKGRRWKKMTVLNLHIPP